MYFHAHRHERAVDGGEQGYILRRRLFVGKATHFKLLRSTAADAHICL